MAIWARLHSCRKIAVIISIIAESLREGIGEKAKIFPLCQRRRHPLPEHGIMMQEKSWVEEMRI
ncbi:hypothetical protein EDM58_00415 [Brevibacillus panacihumi]|uniref:Uncharacterized protein n=1 Tax=Brevibacillus panacihumi TaxID=497735 RepID=A0A3M8DFE3_9BACL|nr:hypothetical protein EDM58_00415 [Brevibacillus panacihumi]